MFRINIRVKLFIIMISILLLTSAILISLTSSVLNRLVINRYEKQLVSFFQDFKKDFNDNLNLSDYVHKKEKGLKGFITLFDSNLTVLLSISPGTSMTGKLPRDLVSLFSELVNLPDFEYRIHNFRLQHDGGNVISIIGQVAPGYYIFAEKNLNIIKEAVSLSNSAIKLTLIIVSFISLLWAYFLAYTFTRPIFKINQKVQAISMLDFDYELSLKNNDEIGDLGKTVNEISGKLKCTMDELINANNQLAKEREHLKELNKQLKELSQTDTLTKLSNRLKVDSVLQDEIYKSEVRGRTFSIILLDIDHFKQVNDKYGHQIGDKVLIDFANILTKHSRRTDLVGRWGGEEFIIILPDTTLDGALSMAENIRKSVSEYSFNEVGQKTASLGVGEYNKDLDISEVIGKIDDALYRAKENGRNRVEFIS